ncbi:MAG: ABC transporter ATP-binding protein [Candidatus Riflebacteria bacterium]|nr:ABC transporter ATP-binding protein [Candidatus Riflebacteria bacterium]
MIEVEGLGKDFLVPEKEPGVWGSLRALVAPRHRPVTAVADVTFTVAPGELLAFIGPNGAGKSTTIKMLTGILHPSRGRARVLGFVPWEDRQQLSFHIGSVFGQRSQLWLHLPPLDSFNLLARMYELPDDLYRQRLDRLVAVFELGDLLAVPVRKLSLGQRMRCEIAAALLHDPRVLFLDEPTIGLDVIAKEAVRDLILRANRDAGVTIFLTSHDAGDIEKLCRRVIIIDHGQVLLDADVQSLRRSPHFSIRTVGARLSRPADGFACDGVEILKRKGPGLKLRVDTAATPIDHVLQALQAYARIEDITVRTPSLDQIIAHIYRQKGLPASAPAEPAEEDE